MSKEKIYELVDKATKKVFAVLGIREIEGSDNSVVNIQIDKDTVGDVIFVNEDGKLTNERYLIREVDKKSKK